MPVIIHALNRGTDKRIIFLDDQDRLRFIHDLYEFNDQERKPSNYYFFAKSNDIEGRQITYQYNTRNPARKLLVDIHAFTLMPNHYHLLLSERVKHGIARFMHKLDMGYSKYFNARYKRTGTLFEGRYKPIPVTKESHLIHLPYYIHCNPLDLSFPGWRGRELVNHEAAVESLKSYRWSSHLDYLGVKNFPSITSRKFLLEMFGGTKGYQQAIRQWLRSMDLESTGKVRLED